MGPDRSTVCAPEGSPPATDPARGRAGRGGHHRRHDRRPAAVPALISLAWLLAAPLLAQTPLERFTATFTEAVNVSVRGRPRDLRAARDLLDEASALVEELEEDRRAQAHFFVEVRRAEVYLRSTRPENLQRAAAIAAEARAGAVSDGVYRGSYRVLVLVLLWQSLPSEVFSALLDEKVGGRTEEDYILDAELVDAVLSQEQAEYLQPPVTVLRSELRLGTPEEYVGLQALRELADELAERPELDRWRQICLQRLAAHFLRQYDYERALVYLEQLPEEETLYPRGLIALKRGDHATAEEVGLRLVAEGDAKGFQLVGDARELDERYQEALEAYGDAEAAARSAMDRSAALNGSGDALLGLGRLPEAEARYLRDLAELADLTPSLTVRAARAETLKDLGRLAAARRQSDVALAHYQSSLAELEEARRIIPLDFFGGTWLGQHGDQLTAVDGILRVGPTVGADPFELLAATEMMKARSLLDSLEGGRHEDDPRVRDAIRQLMAARQPEEIEAGLQELEARRAAQGGVTRPHGTPLDAEALRAWWSKQVDTVLLSYWLGEEHAWLLWGSGGGELSLIELGAADRARELLRDAFEAVAEPAAEPWAALDPAASFYLPASVHQTLAEGERLVVCPDTNLARMPFAALRVGGTPLGVSHAVVRAPSISAIEKLASRQPQGTGVVVLDSVEAPELERALSLDPLIFSEREGDLVERAHARVQRLRGGEATLSNLQAKLEEDLPSLVHVSAHAVDDARVPSQSLLVLADGLVSMRSLAALDLQGSSIVLTACASALGADRRREGFVGIPQGVLGAGARAVVAPIWRVNQQATADLMGQFHHFLAEGMDEAQAMAAARGRLSEAPQYSHPHYWSGFSVFGAFQDTREGTSWAMLGGALVGLFALGFVAICWRYRQRAR